MTKDEYHMVRARVVRLIETGFREDALIEGVLLVASLLAEGVRDSDAD